MVSVRGWLRGRKRAVSTQPVNLVEPPVPQVKPPARLGIDTSLRLRPWSMARLASIFRDALKPISVRWSAPKIDEIDCTTRLDLAKKKMIRRFLSKENDLIKNPRCKIYCKAVLELQLALSTFWFVD